MKNASKRFAHCLFSIARIKKELEEIRFNLSYIIQHFLVTTGIQITMDY